MRPSRPRTLPRPTPTRGVEPAPAVVPIPEGSYFAELPIESITPNPRQPRTVFDEDAMAELVDSIAEVGLLQPVVVRPLGDDRFELVMGERRWRATQAAGLAVIPAIVRETKDHDLLRDALLENLHRAQLNPLEEAAAYQQLLTDFGCTQDELAIRIKRSRPQISNTSDCCGCRRRCSAGSPPACSAPATRGPCSPSPTPPARSGSLSGWWPRGCRCARSRRWSPSARPGRTPRRPAGPVGRSRLPRPTTWPPDCPTIWTPGSGSTSGGASGRITIDFASAEDLERIARLIEQK